MQDKSKFDELLISLLANELSEEDEAFILQWIAFDEKNRLYFEEIKKIWRLPSVKMTVDQVDVNQEWLNFKQAIIKKQQSDAAAVAEPGGYSLADEAVPASRGKLIKLFAATAVAASILFAIALYSGIFNNTGPEKKLIGGIKGKTETLPAILRHEVNYTGKQKRLILKDGSEVTLSDKTELSYQEPFAAGRRDLFLKGEAYFNVASDKSRPFTVYSGHLSTTALGTRFTVTAYEDSNDITVRLYEGKVVVKPDAALREKLVTDFYLLPGQELVYHNGSSSARLRNFLIPPGRLGSMKTKGQHDDQADSPAIPIGRPGNWYMFNNQPLENVFEQLKMIYDVKIVYRKKDVARKYFIKEFEKSEPVEQILEQITLLNDLKLTKKNDTFYISK